MIGKLFQIQQMTENSRNEKNLETPGSLALNLSMFPRTPCHQGVNSRPMNRKAGLEFPCKHVQPLNRPLGNLEPLDIFSYRSFQVQGRWTVLRSKKKRSSAHASRACLLLSQAVFRKRVGRTSQHPKVKGLRLSRSPDEWFIGKEMLERLRNNMKYE